MPAARPPGTQSADRGLERERRRRGVSRPAAVVGLTLDELAARQSGLAAYGPSLPLVTVLNDELARGRVTLDAEGRYAIVRGMFEPDLVEALVELGV